MVLSAVQRPLWGENQKWQRPDRQPSYKIEPLMAAKPKEGL
jgi:hypothetical protein